MGRFGVELAVVGLTVLMTIGFIITYIVAVKEDHVTPDFPYISDTGGKVPESCVFSFICSVASILMLVIMYVRYKHINQHFTDSSVARIQWLNTITFAIGILSMLGLLIVGSFQNDSVEVAHFIGAFMVFGFGMTYCWLQTLLSYKLYKLNYRHGGVVIIVIRLILSISSALFFVITVVTGDLAYKKYDGPSARGTFVWTAHDGGFGLHVTSTATEWLLGASFILYFLTFHIDFQRIRPDVIIRLRYHHSDTTMVNTINENTPLI